MKNEPILEEQFTLHSSIMREKRHKIYDSITQYIGEISPESKKYLSSMLQDYAKTYAKFPLERQKVLENKIVKLKEALGRKSPIPPKAYHPRNKTFVNRGYADKRPIYTNYKSPIKPKITIPKEDPVVRDLVLE